MTSSATSNPTQKRMHRTPEHQQSASHCTLSLSVAYPHPHGTLDARPQHYLSSLTVLLRQKQAKELHLSLSLSLSLIHIFRLNQLTKPSPSLTVSNTVKPYVGTSPIEKEKKQVFGTCSGVRCADLKSQAHIQNISLSFSMFCTATYVTLVSTPSRLARKMTKMGRWCGEKQKNVDV